MILQGEDIGKIKEILRLLQETLGRENVFLEIVAQDEAELPEVKKINTAILQLSAELDIPCFVNNDYCYVNKEDKETREVALAIKDGLKLYDPQRRKPKGEYYIMSEEDIRTICKKN